MDYLHLKVTHAVADGKSRRVTWLHDEPQAINIEIFYEFDRVMPWSDETMMDGHVLPILLYAMSIGKTLRVHGPLSHGIMRNIEELQLIWRLWKPTIYKKIDIIPDRIADVRRGAGQDKAIAAFSGGVDATFTALRHTRTLPEKVRYPLSDVLMVHGFDVAVDNTRDFNDLMLRVTPLLDELHLNLHTIRTNSKTLGLQNWEDSFALELSGCLHMFSDDFQFGLVGSSEPYNGLVLPWGSSPVTDYLMSGDKFEIVHDGAGFLRTEKVAEVAKNVIACTTLKVCWEGSVQSGNCGHCEKCVRTQLNFLAAGCKIPPCFPPGFDINYINSINIRNVAQLAELSAIIRYADLYGATGHWLPVLKKRVKSWRPLRRHQQLRLLMLSVLVAIGMKEHIKKLRYTLQNMGRGRKKLPIAAGS